VTGHTSGGIAPLSPPEPTPLHYRSKINADGVCDFAARPSLSSVAQPIFWSPAAVSSVLTLMPAPKLFSDLYHPELTDVQAAREGPEGTYTIYSADAPTQLLMFSDRLPRKPLVAAVPIDAEFLSRIEALTRFWRVLNGRRLVADTRLTHQQRQRLRLMLQAIDGRMNGASYREIAVAIYGEGRVASDPWKTSPLRDSVIGLVESGSAAVAGGYLKLLRHRRRS